MEQHLIAYYVGIAIVILSHVWLLVVNNSSPRKFLTQNDINIHAGLNLLAAALIAYYFLYTEGKINW